VCSINIREKPMYVVSILDHGKPTNEIYGPFATREEAEKVGQTSHEDWIVVALRSPDQLPSR